MSTTKISKNEERNGTKTMKKLRCFGVSMVLALLIIFLKNTEALPHARAHQRTIRLCSKSLSDALYLVCRERGGYNEPFSYSGEVEMRTNTGPGLVEECCYRPCSYEQLEQYCKPLEDDKNNDDDNDNSEDGIEESYRIVNLPYTSTRELATDRRAVAIENSDNESGKSKESNLTRLENGKRANSKARKHAEKFFKGKKKRRKNDKNGKGFQARKNGMKKNSSYNNIDKADLKINSKLASRRRKRPKHPSRTKILREADIPVVPEFKVGTTIPEPKDSIFLLFPSRTNLVIQRTAKNLADSLDFEKFD